MNSLSLVKRKVLECAHLRVSKTAFFTTVQTRGGLAARCILYDCRIQFFLGGVLGAIKLNPDATRVARAKARRSASHGAPHARRART